MGHISTETKPSNLLLAPALAILFCAAFLGMTSTSTAAPGDGACTINPANRTGSNLPFDGVCGYLSEREGVQQAAIFDNETNDTYVLSTGNATQYTASIAKVDILARWLN